MSKKALTKKQVNKIKSLRQKGHSLPELKRELPFGYGTIFKYIKGVEILPEFKDFWLDKKRASTYKMKKAQEEAKSDADKIIRVLNKKERIIIATCLYWAEGSKRDFSLSNTDPALVRVYVKCLESLGIGKERLTINLRIFEDIDKEKACEFWSKIVGVSRDKVSYVVMLSGKKKGKLEYGMCRIRVTKGSYHHKLMDGLRDIISEKA